MNNGTTVPLLYVLPNLTPGAVYKIRLHWATFGDGGAGRRSINVLINGAPAISHLDVYAAAGGDLKAIVREVSGIADGAGNLIVGLTADTGYLYVSAFINAIEVVLASSQINCGGTATGGFVADEYFSSTSTMGTASTGSSVSTGGVTNPAPMACYQSLRFLQNGSTTLVHVATPWTGLLRPGKKFAVPGLPVL